MTDYYAGMDTHSEVTCCEVQDDKGKVFSQNLVATDAKALAGFVKAIPGRVHLTFEEGHLASWLYDLLKPHVYKIVVCDPRKIRNQTSKDDSIDAHRLTEMLRGGQLKHVHHDNHGTRPLKESVRTYRHIIEDSTRTKNRLKSLFRSRAIATKGDSIYSIKSKDEWLLKLDSTCFREHAESLYCQLELLTVLKEKTKGVMLCEARKHRACRIIASIPGIGPIRASFIVAEVDTPFRFRTKRQFWSYCGLAVVVRSSADYEVHDGALRRKKKHGTTRGLNRNSNRLLKEVYKGAATDALRGDIEPFYQRRVEEGMKPEMAKLCVARKLAAMSLAIWKKGETYDVERALMRTE